MTRPRVGQIGQYWYVLFNRMAHHTPFHSRQKARDFAKALRVAGKGYAV